MKHLGNTPVHHGTLASHSAHSAHPYQVIWVLQVLHRIHALMLEIGIEEPLTSNVRPATDALITVRIVKSFPYRNVKNHIVPLIDLKLTTPSQLLEQIRQIIATTGSLRPYRNVHYDTIKVYTHAHGTKSMNLVINFDHDDRDILCCENSDYTKPLDKSLWELGVENETEVSVFNYLDYVAFKANPEEKW